MKKAYSIIAFLFVAILLALLIGCKQAPLENNQGNLFNESLNQQIENLTSTNISANVSENISAAPAFKEFYFNFTSRPEAKYEIAKDDVFTISKGNFNSTQISFLGVMLGDSYDYVMLRLGEPDAKLNSEKEGLKNLDYNKRIGINGNVSAMTLHFENNTLTRITIKPLFNKYLHGNTTLGQSKEYVYAVFDVPDYQSFLSYLKVFHYVEKGVEFYFRAKNVDIISFIIPADFKGVKYVTQETGFGGGIITNVTEPVENK
jgi:hypothetical protein